MCVGPWHACFLLTLASEGGLGPACRIKKGSLSKPALKTRGQEKLKLEALKWVNTTASSASVFRGWLGVLLAGTSRSQHSMQRPMMPVMLASRKHMVFKQLGSCSVTFVKPNVTLLFLFSNLHPLRGQFWGEWIHVYVYLSPFAGHLKLSQYC